MLLPRFTIKQLLLIITAFGGISCVLGFAAQGSAIAYGFGVALFGLVIPLATMALIYWLLYSYTHFRADSKLPDGPKKPTTSSSPPRNEVSA